MQIGSMSASVIAVIVMMLITCRHEVIEAAFTTTATARKYSLFQTKISLSSSSLHAQLPTARVDVDENYCNDDCEKNTMESSSMSSRRNFISTTVNAAMAGAAVGSLPSTAFADVEGEKMGESKTTGGEGGVTLYKTKSGLKYIDLKEGTGPGMRYGDLVAIHYKGYVELPNKNGGDKKRQMFDESDFLMKHGNLRTIPGIEEGIHTMRQGGIRRLIIPPKLGYAEGGLGPIPESPLSRFWLNRLLDQMVELRGGNMIFDVEVILVREDEADQGYYDDLSMDPEEFEQLRLNSQAAARKAKEDSMANAIKQAPML